MGDAYNYSSYIGVEQGLWQPLCGKINKFRAKILGLHALERTSSAHALVHDRKVPHMYCWSPAICPKPTDWPDYIDGTIVTIGASI